MTDIVDKATRSRMMASIKGRDTKPELGLRKALHHMGYRYRLHGRDLPGRPDMVFPKFQAVVLVHGCFWHRHSDCRFATTPSNNADFWREKLEGNVARDARNHARLRALGWRIATVWECATRSNPPDFIARTIDGWLRSDRVEIEISERVTT